MQHPNHCWKAYQIISAWEFCWKCAWGKIWAFFRFCF